MDEFEKFSSLVGTEKRHSPKTKGAFPSLGESVSASDTITAGSIISTEGGSGESRWSESDGMFWRSKKTHSSLPAGLYECLSIENIGPSLRKKPLETDDLLILPERNTEFLIKQFQQFWKPETKAKFKELSYIYKRGIMLWGPQGSGKTSLVNLMMLTLIREHNGLIITVDNPNIAAACLLMLRKNEPNRPLITLAEDLDALIERYGEAEYLSLYDGADQVSNVIHITSTNYPERLDRRFVDRPSRFDIVRYIGMPSDEARRMYFRNKISNFDWFSEKLLDNWVEMTEGFSISHLKEIVISVHCFGTPIEEIISRMIKLKQKLPNSDSVTDEHANKIGFGR